MLKIALASASTVLELTSEFDDFFTCMFADANQTIVSVEDHAESIEKAEVAAADETGEGFEPFLVYGKVAYKFCQ
jgi:pyrimidine deaminase RibD-like protein